jgi:hypothetical protein
LTQKESVNGLVGPAYQERVELIWPLPANWRIVRLDPVAELEDTSPKVQIRRLFPLVSDKMSPDRVSSIMRLSRAGIAAYTVLIPIITNGMRVAKYLRLGSFIKMRIKI